LDRAPRSELVTHEVIPAVRAALRETAELRGAVQVLAARVEDLTGELALLLAPLGGPGARVPKCPLRRSYRPRTRKSKPAATIVTSMTRTNARSEIRSTMRLPAYDPRIMIGPIARPATSAVAVSTAACR